MYYYFAPMEGITGYIYRRVYDAFYPGLDRYYIPFIVPKEKKCLSAKERDDVLPEHNCGTTAIPQIMTNKAEEFLRITKFLCQEYGYTKINLNLGCPSKTVVSKKRGSGFLTMPDHLKKFLDEVCNGIAAFGVDLSVKTRIGKDSPDEFLYLLDIFAQFPLSELIVHPRVQADYYGNRPHKEAFAQAYQVFANSNCQLCYNGDLFCVSDYLELCEEFPNLKAVMMGRGLLKNPMLADEIKVRENGGTYKQDRKTIILRRFQSEEIEEAERKRRYTMYQRMQKEYLAVLSGDKNVLFKMKELWFYMCQDFTEPQRYWKKMKKAQNLSDFERAVNALCTEQRLLNNLSGETGTKSNKGKTDDL